MRKTSTKALYASLFLAAIFLAGGYAFAGSWVGILSVLAMAVCWMAARRFKWEWLASVLLAAYLVTAAGGILNGISSHLMIAGSSFALVAWELAGQNTGSEDQPIRVLDDSYRQRSLKLLVLSVGPGLIAAELLLSLRLPVSFGWLFFAALLALFGLFMFFRMMKSR